jgi:hypothetical protein
MVVSEHCPRRHGLGHWWSCPFGAPREPDHAGPVTFSALSRDAKFARDSPLEGSGFEPSVPL